jgi:hypothetical protein
MPTFLNVLYDQDLNFLESIEEFWDISVRGKEARAKAEALAWALDNPPLIRDQLASLPPHVEEALRNLKSQGGYAPWTAWTRDHGPLRSMGPGKRKREKPGVFPVSTTEYLWYRGLMGRTFLKGDETLTEVAFLPEEIAQELPDSLAEEKPGLQLRPLENIPAAEVTHASRILDDLCTLLASLRRPDKESALLTANPSKPRWLALEALAQSIGLINGQIPTEIARNFLELPRGEALRWLVQSWMVSTDYDELKFHPDWRLEGTWQHDPRRSRLTLLKLLAGLGDRWYAIADLIQQIRVNTPDFLRTGADYDTWLVVSNLTNTLLRGVESWDSLESRFVEEFLTLTAFQLGLLDLDDGSNPQSFHLSAAFGYFTGLIEVETPGFPVENCPILVSPAGKLEMTNLTPRLARYQTSRFGEILKNGPERFDFQVTPQSLKIASKQGLKASHLLKLLRQYGRQQPSPALIQLLKRWEEKGRESWIDQPLVLHLPNTEILQSLKTSPASAGLGEVLGPTAVVVKPGSERRVQTALARLGLLTDFETKIHED